MLAAPQPVVRHVPRRVAPETSDAFAAVASLRLRPDDLARVTRSGGPVSVPIVVTEPAQMPQIEAVALPEPRRQHLPPIDMGLPGEANSHGFTSLHLKTGHRAAVRRWTLRATTAILVSVIAGGGFIASDGYFKIHKVFKGTTATVASLKANVDPSLLKGEGDGRVNILLLGRGGGNHDAPDLTDTMIIASIDPIGHTATLLSVPRDLWVDVPSYGTMKINAAYETGKFKKLGRVDPSSNNPQAIQAGLNLVDQTIESVFSLPIHYNMMLDFQAFSQAVDTVGGIGINVPTDLVDPTMAWENGYNPVLAKAGQQTFDGKHALIYVRSRETTSDFARAERQRAVMLALKEKVVTLGTLSNPLKIAGLINAFGDNVSTDLSLNDASRVYSIMRSIDNAKIASLGLADPPNSFVTTGNMNGQSIVLPRAGLFNYEAIQKFVRSQLKDGYIISENARIMVINGTTLPGLATAHADELKTYGYNIIGTANAPTSAYEQTVLVDLSHGKNKYTKHYLEQRFNTKAVSQLPDSQIPVTDADFAIILGSDATTSSQN